MSGADLLAHLGTGVSHVCRCWEIRRQDGLRLGFTDHDRSLTFDGLTFRADGGMTALSVSQTTGLSVDNTEAAGVLSDPAVTEADIEAGRYDGAVVRSWLVRWDLPDARMLRFAGTIGEIRRGGGAFHAELRGLTEALNQPRGRAYQRPCTAVLGDPQCRFDLGAKGYAAELQAEAVERSQSFRFTGLDGFEPGWFSRGRLRVLSGAAQGLAGLIKSDRFDDEGRRRIDLWQALGAEVRLGDVLRIEAGCDKQRGTCHYKFGNILNFRGFPHIPGEDWLVSVPQRAGLNDGGSLNQ
ncbi:MAG: DUF2163 domain-containing protein [Limimaricola sp.]|uniref:DUF2163 domain-containing protein n=1 Tax=Limimaricola sp. TaxID=2211665 RepID=UPI001DFEA3E8|nr:DUF2163 domain-containing protein [Limimaricola sp.]MBI1416690.1 DUF2163 domain-containing protein [Limimaricola sp.]